MKKHIPSIFNDVVGPIMRGPSSSHSAAALRIGRMCRDLMGGNLEKVEVHYDQNDALATTHESQGSDMGMKGGILGFEADDPRLLELDKHLADAGIEISFKIGDSGKSLPNLYQVELQNPEERIRVEAISTGGGMIKILEINGTAVSMMGDCFETLLWSKESKVLLQIKEGCGWAEEKILYESPKALLELRSYQAPDPAWIESTRLNPDILQLQVIQPVLPVLARGKDQVPFSSCEEMMIYHDPESQDPWEAALAYESARGGISREEVRTLMDRSFEVMRKGVESGLRGTDYQDRILGSQSPLYKAEMEKGKLSKDDALHRITL